MLGVAAGVVLLLAPDLSAQMAMPDSPAPSVAKEKRTNNAVEAGTMWLAHTRAALTRKDYKTAISGFRESARIVGFAPQLAGDLAQLRLDMQIAGIKADMLQPAKTNPPAKTMGSPAGKPVAMTPKKQALQMIAIGKAALDRGEIATAVQYARQAQALNVPESEFLPGEPRVWQFVLDAESAAKRSGVVQASAVAPVQQAGTFVGDASTIAQVPYNAGAGQGAVRQVQAEDLDAGALGLPQTFETPRLPAASSGEDIYMDGLQALKAGNKELARKRFVEAWQYEGTLPQEIRRQLKDKLTLLQSPTPLPRTSSPSDMASLTPAQRADMEAQQEVRRLYREITSELASAAETNKTAPMDALDQLNVLRRRVDGAEVDETSKRGLLAQVDRALIEQRKYVDANRSDIERKLENESVRQEIETKRARDIAIDEEIKNLVKQFNDLLEQQRYSEAEVIAKNVQELKPGSPIATSMSHVAQLKSRRAIFEEIRAAKEETFVRQGFANDRASVYNPDMPYEMPSAREWNDISTRRLAQDRENLRMSDRERQILDKLESAQVNIKYNARPLNEVLAEISSVTGVPIVSNKRAMAAIRVMPDVPVTLDISTPISLKSGLHHILDQFELTYVIDNDVLNITTIEAKRTNVEPRTYHVADLVTPIPNFTQSYDAGLTGALRAAYQMTSPQTDVRIMPVSVADLARGNAAAPMSNPNMLGQYSSMGSQQGFGGSAPAQGRGGGAFADFQSLIDLIQTTVVPDTWEALGGPSTMAEYAQNLSLVISTTSDVHDQISDLLESLRALQNLQITIEVRFITLSDTFFEQIGVDFDVQFDDNTQALPDDDSGPGVTIGFDGIAGLPTPDLDITFNNNSFGVTSPFGAPDAGAISTIGFAILSDIEAFFFLQAAQGDTRNNVMQAPKVTLFDGQFASINDQTQRPFVTSITPVVGDFAVAQQPVIVVLNEGTQLNVQGIVSNDKRFVRLTLVPFFSQIGDVDTFTFEGRQTTQSSSRDENGDTNGDGQIDDLDEVDTVENIDITEGTTVQLPTFAFTTINTTVSVPDGGTILLGGIKRMAEGRAERGVPFLSKIPYVSRLFRNTAVGRDASSLMMMVTPRIIIQEEEEEAQTGFRPNR